MNWVGWIAEQGVIAWWFFSGVYWGQQVWPRTRIEVVPGPERLPELVQQQMAEITFEARTCGRGFVSWRNMMITIEGVQYHCQLTCNGDQFGARPEVEKRR